MELSKLKNLLGFQSGQMVFEEPSRALPLKKGVKEVIPHKIFLDGKGNKYVVLNGKRFQVLERSIVGATKPAPAPPRVIKVYSKKKPEESAKEAVTKKDVFLSPRVLGCTGSMVVVKTVEDDRTMLNLVSTPEFSDSHKMQQQFVECKKIDKLTNSTKTIVRKSTKYLTVKDKVKPRIKFVPGDSIINNTGNPPVTEEYQQTITKQFKKCDLKVMTEADVSVPSFIKLEPGVGVPDSKLSEVEVKNLATTSTNTEKCNSDKEVQTKPFNPWEILIEDNKSDIIIGANVNMGTGPKSINYSYNEPTKIQFFEDLRSCLKRDSGNLPIHKAVIQNDFAAVKTQCVVLKIRNAGVNILDANNYTPLHLAIINNANIAIVQVLLNYKADMSILDPEGNNVLHLAVQYDRDDLLTLFLDNLNSSNLDIDQYNYEGLTPLICCSTTSDKVQMAELLLKKGAEVNARDQKSGKTAIFHATETHNVSMVSLLLEYAADTKIRNFFGTSAHDAVFELEDLPKDIKFQVLGYVKFHQKRKLNADHKGTQLEDPLKIRKLEMVPKLRKIAPKVKCVSLEGDDS